MDLECGNPLVKTLPQVVAQVKPVQQEIVLPPAEAPPAVVELPTEPPVVEAPVQEAPVIAQQMTVPEPQVEVLGVPPVEFSSAASLLSKAILPGLLTELGCLRDQLLPLLARLAHPSLELLLHLRGAPRCGLGVFQAFLDASRPLVEHAQDRFIRNKIEKHDEEREVDELRDEIA